MTVTIDRPTHTDAPPRPRSALFSALIGVTSLGVLLQGVWAGMFVREGQGNNDTWVEVHARGAEVTLALAVVAAVVALVKLRRRRDVVVGSVALVVLLALEAFIGGLVGDHPGLQAVHFPLAMALLGLAVWLPTRAVRRV